MNPRINELKELILNKLCRPKDYNTFKQRWIRGEVSYLGPDRGGRTEEELRKAREKAAEKARNWKPKKGTPDWPSLLDELISLTYDENKKGE